MYVALDTAVGELVRSVGSHTTVMLVSGDGMGPNYSGSHLLEDVLVRLGVLTTAGAVESADRCAVERKVAAPRETWRAPCET